MIRIPIPSNHKSFQLEIVLFSRVADVVGVIATDETKPYTDYLRRKFEFSKEDKVPGGFKRSIIIKLPLSPKELTVIAYSKNFKNKSLKVIDLKVSKLDQSALWVDSEMKDFLKFSGKFCVEAGYRKTGFIESPQYQFLIQYLPKIKDQFGNVLITPARTHRQTGRIQVSQDLFRRVTIPVRMFIMLHERHHFSIPSRDEIEVDLASLKIYLDFGFPSIEAIYSATKVFRMHPDSLGSYQVDRTRKIVNAIRTYKSKRAV